MDPNKDIAEERLLRVIEGGGKTTASSLKAAGAGQVAVQKKKPFSFLTKMFSSTPRVGGGVRFSLPLVNNILWVILALLGIYLAADFLMFQQMTKQSNIYELPGLGIPTVVNDSLTDVSIKPRPETKPIDAYSSIFKDRNPFTGQAPSRPKLPAPRQEESIDLTSITEGLVLVGINRGAEPEAFIEDTIQKRTYFVKKGQQFKNLTVKEVQANLVIAEYQGKEVQIG